MDIYEIMKIARMQDASDIHLTVGTPLVIRVAGEMKRLPGDAVSPDDAREAVSRLLEDEQWKTLEKNGELDFAFDDKGGRRYRGNIFRQKGCYSMVLRLIQTDIPSMETLGLPEVLSSLTEKKRGLVIVTGPTGSGKSTTLAAMVDKINSNKSCHILTLEDPIEYVHTHKRSIINQREVGRDSLSYAAALRASLREDPDVILVGEMRDLETISLALTAAETGHLVMSTLHTVGAVKTIDRIIDVFPPHQQQQVRMQLSTVLQAVISQQLVPKAQGGGRVAAFEIMTGTPAVANLIREGKTFQLTSVLQTGAASGMILMDVYLMDLYRKKLITYETVLHFAIDRDTVQRMSSLTK